ncbi:hypothetical protein CJD50_21720 [Hafnia paralvei]|uniref:Uncharacterized protein n=1 Tax=Hafnia paralvei TaxID=546367 RepID=A0A2A2M765_9GAMM|nr:hypothetical protein CJD50_21720 [Hafnia paralvei]
MDKLIITDIPTKYDLYTMADHMVNEAWEKITALANEHLSKKIRGFENLVFYSTRRETEGKSHAFSDAKRQRCGNICHKKKRKQ